VENDGCAEIGGTPSGARFDDELRENENGGRGAASSSSSSSSSRNRPTHAAGSSGQQGAGASSESNAVLKRQRLRDSAMARLQRKED